MTSWTARFITPQAEGDGAPRLRHEFDLATGHGPVASAELQLSALGVVEAWIDGVPVSDELLTPGWTSYEWRLRHTSTDVTALVGAPRSALALVVGDGWWRGRLGWGQGATPYGEEVAGFAELRIRFADGHEQLVVTDGSWRTSPGETTANSLYDGQEIDARRREEGWQQVGFDDSGWGGVQVCDVDLGRLEPYLAPPVRRLQELAPHRVWTSPSGRVLVDFGQNLVGWVRLRACGPAGKTITLRHAEVLEHEELGVRPLRTARATDRFTLSGGEDVFEPTLTFHGFRYAEVDGWPGDLAALEGALSAVVVGSDLRRTGWFRCSDDLLNRFHDNVLWGMRGNFLDVPTDCPQRDERMGWTGDIAAFAPTAVYLADVQDFLRDWLRDLAAEQAHHDGVVPFVVPDVLKKMAHPPQFQPFDSTAVWSDAAVWVPWAVWQAHGDPVVLAETFDSMLAHLRRVRSLLSPTGLWDQGFQFGDWLDPDAPADRPADAKADPGVVATACVHRSATLAARAAAVLGREAERRELDELANLTRDAFQRHYVEDQRLRSDATTVYALAIVFGLLDADQLGWAGQRLAELVRESGHRISTGFAGTPFIADALSSTGHLDDAYRLVLQRECPSWLYQVEMGATTVWERWDSMLPDGSINPGEMTSFNHYALGAVADWLHRVVGGLAPLEPGYRRILVAPRPGGGLAWAESRLETPHGEARVRWERAGEGLELTVLVPAGTTARLDVPGTDVRELEAGEHRISVVG